MSAQLRREHRERHAFPPTPASDTPNLGEDPPTGEGLVAALESDRIAATLAADTDTLETLIAAHATYVHANGDVDTGRDYLDKLRRGVYVYESIDVDQQHVRALPSAALVVFRMRASLRVNGTRRQAVSRCTAVWTPEGDAFRLSAFQATPLPSADWAEPTTQEPS